LTQRSKPRNYKNKEILDSCAQYIKDQFKSYGISETFEQKYGLFKNIIGEIGPKASELIVVGAHYDVYGNMPGADDNASGIAGLLETARLLMQHDSLLKNRIQFVAYSTEEPPFFRSNRMGSYLHVLYLKDNKQKPKVMICLEMIGNYNEDKNTQEFPIGIMKWFYGSRGNFILNVSDIKSSSFAKDLSKTINQNTNIQSKYLIAPRILPGVDFSDHMNYWKFHMKAIMVTDCAFYRNKNYHSEDDKMQYLNFTKMSEVVKGLSIFILNQAQSQKKKKTL
jgi:hypothetical protein